VKLEFRDWMDPRPGFWLSLLYGLLEGISGALDVERRDIDGCLYTPLGSSGTRALILFDDVPGRSRTCQAYCRGGCSPQGSQGNTAEIEPLHLRK